MKLFTTRYKNKRVFLEIESTVSKQVEDYDIKIRRKAFYERNGLESQGYLVNLFGVEMEIMSFNCDICFEEYYAYFVGE